MLKEENIIEFREKGYTILLDALTKDELSLLHEEADILSNFLMSEGYDLIMDFGCVIEPWNCGYLELFDDDYKVDVNKYSKIRNSIIDDDYTNKASDIILHKYGYTWASQLLDAQQKVYLLNEQFIMKPPCTSKLSQFAWHKDSDYYTNIHHRNEATVACWTALDTVNENNGTVEIQDFLGDNKILDISAGSVVFMSNQLLHKSTGNSSRTFRRAYMTQFSKRPLVDDKSQYVGLAVPCTGIAEFGSK